MVKLKYFIKALEKSYSHAPHLQDLPGDLNTRDPEILKARKQELNERIKSLEKELKGKGKKTYYQDYMSKRMTELDLAIVEEQSAYLEDTFKPFLNKLRDNINQSIKEWSKKEPPRKDVPAWEHDYVHEAWEENMFNLNTMLEYIDETEKTIKTFNKTQAKKQNRSRWERPTEGRDISPMTKAQSDMCFLFDKVRIENKERVYQKQKVGPDLVWAFDKQLVKTPENEATVKKQMYSFKDYNFLRGDYISSDYAIERNTKMNELRDYRYDKARLEQYCRENNIKI